MEEGDFTVCGIGYTEYQALLMRRLISLFRSSENQQTICNDFECTDSLPGLQPLPESGCSVMMMMMGWFAVALALYHLRPASLRSGNNSKSSDRGSGSDGPPPGAPPAVN